MDFWYYRKGKLIKRKIPKNNNKVPKTKRLRKKKFWFFCSDCRQWLKRYKTGKGTLSDGKSICSKCIVNRINKAKTK